MPLAPAIGIDFGGTSVKLGSVRGAEIIARGASIPTSGHTRADDLFADLVRGVARLRASLPEGESVSALGVGLPGPVDFQNGVVHELSNVPGWTNVPLRDQLRRETGLPTVVIDNDAKAMTYAEWKYGAGRGARNVVCVTLGTGVGGGLILDGRLYRGSGNGAGEIGNMTIDYRGLPGNYGNFGSVEKYVGNREITARAVELYARAGRALAPEESSPAALAAAALAGDALAEGLWRETGELLGACLADIVWLLNPDKLVLGGGVAGAGELLFAPVRATIAARTSRVFWEKLKVVPAALGPDAGLIGAAALAADASVASPSPA